MLARLDHKVMGLRRIAMGSVHLDRLRARQSTAAEGRGTRTSRTAANGRRSRWRTTAGQRRPFAKPKPTMTPLVHTAVVVRENVLLARQTYRIRLQCPELARAIRPGQFLMIRLPGRTDPLLGRPFALYDTVLDDAGQPDRHRCRLSRRRQTDRPAGGRCGPASASKSGGRSATASPISHGLEHVALVAGGIGQTPFLAHVRELLGTRGYGGRPPRAHGSAVSLYYGVRTADLAAGVEDFRAAGATVHLASDDGSARLSRLRHATARNSTHRRNTSSAAVPSRCSMRWRSSPSAGACRVISRWKRRWPAASASVSAA